MYIFFTESDCTYGWIGDLFCNDENNKEECQWDGGDCCPDSDPMDGWDDYCNDCQCLNEPLSTTYEVFTTSSG